MSGIATPFVHHHFDDDGPDAARACRARERARVLDSHAVDAGGARELATSGLSKNAVLGTRLLDSSSTHANALLL